MCELKIKEKIEPVSKNSSDKKNSVMAFYKFIKIENIIELQKNIKSFCLERNIKGTVLVAKEGVNGTISGSMDVMNQFANFIRDDIRFNDIEIKESYSSYIPFERLKIRLKKEIVALDDARVNPEEFTGIYVEPENWNDIISKKNVINIDTRNDYEYDIGSFKGAINPKTKNFKEFKNFVKKNLDPKVNKEVAMFCTGGIRCEKASNFMMQEGFEKVYHLKGGVLKYLEEIPKSKSFWEGECFVFDNRISVKHGLEIGNSKQCRNCNRSLRPEDLIKSKEWEDGVSCKYCFDETTDNEKARFRKLRAMQKKQEMQRKNINC